MEKTMLIENLKTIRDNHFAIINEFVQNVMPGWKVTRFGYNNINLGFENGETWENGTPRTTDIDMYIGYEQNYNYDTHTYDGKYFKFQINPFTAGSFNILDSDENGYAVNDGKVLHKYFSGVGFILNNTSFANKLKNLLIAFTDEYEAVKEKLDEIEEAEIAEASKIAREKAEKEAKEHYDKIVKLMENPYYQYVIIKKPFGGNFIYRNKNVDVVNVCLDWNEACKTLRNEHLPYGWNRDSMYKIIEKSKIKVAPFKYAA